MVDTYTSNLRFTKPEVGANLDAWATLLNAGMIQLIEDALAGETAVDVTAGNVTLTENNGATDQARSMFLRVTGTPGVSRTIDTASASKVYIVKNDSDSDVVIEPAVGTGVTINSGNTAMVYVEAGVAAYEVAADGEYIPVTGGTLTTVAMNVVSDATIEDTTTMYYHLQGNMVYMSIDPWSIVTGIAASDLGLVPTSGSWPSELVPSISGAVPVMLQEDTGGGFADFISQLRLQPSTVQSWDFVSLSPTSGNDYRMINPLTFVYSLGAPA